MDTKGAAYVEVGALLLAALLVAPTTQAEKRDPGGNELRITSAQVEQPADKSAGKVLIGGSHFVSHRETEVTVTLAGEPLLLIGTPTATEIVAELPAGYPSGTYLLVIYRRNQHAKWDGEPNRIPLRRPYSLMPAWMDEFDLTIGGVGPAGPKGDKGDNGEPGVQGPPGLLASFDSIAGLPCTVRGAPGTIELGYDSTSTVLLRCVVGPSAKCGNGIPEPPEGCDDANTTSGDGCSGTCETEPGYVCVGQPSLCHSGYVCGNNLAEGSEVCDGTDLRGQSCLSLGFSGGTLKCATDCTNFNTSTCTRDCNASGTYLAAPSVSYSCAFGLVDFNVTAWTFADLGNGKMVVRGSGLPRVMSGAVASCASGTGFTVSESVPGTCEETYRLQGQFSDANNWSGTFSAIYSGSGGSCFNCVNQVWQVSGRR